MARLKNISGNPIDLFAQAGEADSYLVGADEVVTVPGDVTNGDDADADHYVVGDGDAARLWPKTAWLLDVEKPAAKRKTTSDSGE